MTVAVGVGLGVLVGLAVGLFVGVLVGVGSLVGATTDPLPVFSTFPSTKGLSAFSRSNSTWAFS
ncbi:MAG: hypothetical protein EBS85_05860 [Micrococcales bacterium]|nr:hypothetical protein [Micrococcales bacterium]